ncbi:MAG: Adaptive-response sensory-kinase SasA [Elusimicrobia bacterium]|nr:Adaptive-response sensory-kinase SasA [Elusimicrobiota bacterium]
MLQDIALFVSTHLQFKLHGILNVTAGLFDISVGLIVLLNNPRAKMNRMFFLLTLSTGIWVFFFGLQSLVKTNETILLCQSLAYIGGIPFIPTCFFLFGHIWVGEKQHPFHIWTWITWSIMAMLAMVFFTPTFVGIARYPWGIFPYFKTTPIGIAYAVFLLFPFFLNAVLTFQKLIKGMKAAHSPRERAQFRNFLIGYVIAYMGSVDFLTAFQIPIYPAGYLFLTLFIGIVAYTIARHQIFDINILVRKFTVILLIYVVLFAFLLPMSLVFFNENDRDHWPKVMGLGVIFGLALSMGPIIYAFLLRHTFWLRGQSATGLTHELKSPLVAIQGALEALLQQQTTATPDKLKTINYLHMIERNAQRLEIFVNDLLKLAKIQNDEVPLTKTPINLTKLIQESIEFHQAIAEQKKLSIKFSTTDPLFVELDPSRIQQVLSNILSNAIKFSDQGDIRVQLGKKGSVVICSISDKGIGILKSDLEKIFSRFFQGRHSTKGSGIGLTIAKAWVEAHGGKIWAESEGEGKGTTVTFTLPI